MGHKNIEKKCFSINQLKSYSIISFGTHKQPDYLQNAKEQFIKEDFNNYDFNSLSKMKEN